MNAILTVIKKEFSRFFKDVRLLLTAVLLPGIMIFAVYSLIGTIMESVANKDAEVKPVVCVFNMPDSQNAAFGAIFDLNGDLSAEDAKSAVKNGELDLLVIFPEEFDKKVDEYQVGAGEAPNVEIYFNGNETKSQTAYYTATTLLDAHETALANKFDINRGLVANLADAESTSKMVMSMVVPMVLMMLLFSGCMAVAPESIAGEKERGTIATLLVTPVKRSSIAIGKIIALSAIALLSGLSSGLGLVLSLPKLAGAAGGGITLSIFTFGDVMGLLGIILSTVLILVTLISIISAFAKSVKEASGYVVPLMILVMLCGIFSMFVTGVSPIALSFVPLLNSATCISAIISGAFNAAAFAITVCVNLAFTALLAFVLTLMFNSEKIMFKK